MWWGVGVVGKAKRLGEGRIRMVAYGNKGGGEKC